MKFETKYNIWNYVFTLLFVLIVFIFTITQSLNIRNVEVNFLILILLALSTQRLTRFITKDKIIKSFREFIKNKSKNNSFFYTINELIICPWCTSMWMALFIGMLYFTAPILSIPFLVVLSISSIASIIQILLSKI